MGMERSHASAGCWGCRAICVPVRVLPAPALYLLPASIVLTCLTMHMTLADCTMSSPYFRNAVLQETVERSGYGRNQENRKVDVPEVVRGVTEDSTPIIGESTRVTVNRGDRWGINET